MSSDTNLLPRWAQEFRAQPNVMIRCGLFQAYRCDETVAEDAPTTFTCPDGTQIRYSGPLLSQGECDVWLALLNLASIKQSLALSCSIYELLEWLDRGNDGKEYEKLKSQIERLAEAKPLVIRQGRHLMGSLLSVTNLKSEQPMNIMLNKDVPTMFKGGYTRINWSIRRKMARSPLAQWLHSFYSSHTDAAPYSFEKLKIYCGQEDRNTFNRDMKAAVAIMRKHCEQWWINIKTGSRRNPGYQLFANPEGKSEEDLAREKEERKAKKKAEAENKTHGPANEKPASSPGKSLIGEVDLTDKSKRLKLQAELNDVLASMTDADEALFKVLSVAAETFLGRTKSSLVLNPVTITQAHLEAALYVRSRPARNPELREYLQTVLKAPETPIAPTAP